MDVGVSNMEGFQTLVDHSASADIYASANAAKENMKKDTIIAYPADKSGCGNVRIINPLNYLNATGKHNSIISNVLVHQNEQVLKKTKSIWFQRPNGIEHVKDFTNNKEAYDKLKVKLVIDHDDMLFGKNERQGGTIEGGIPSYNAAYRTVNERGVENAVNIMNMVDRITVSVPYLGEQLKSIGVETEIFHLPNAIPMYLWGKEKRPDIKSKIVKPRVLYTGAPLHYSNTEKLEGDFKGAWKEWIYKNVLTDSIDLFIFGVEVPWFLMPVAHKVHLLKFCDYLDYPNVVRGIKANLGIAPLVENDFNRCKSDIKFLEYAACGVPFIGSSFTKQNSPYENYNKVPQDVTVEQLDELVSFMMEPEHYNAIKNNQYQTLVSEGRYTESKKYLNTFMEALFLDEKKEK